MKILDEKLGCKLIGIERIVDNRGWFQIVFNQNDLDKIGVDFRGVCQLNHSRTEKTGIVRGLNYQDVPYAQSKVVRCIKGALYSVAVDIDPCSETFGKWCGYELSEENEYLMYIPRLFAHGFIVNVQSDKNKNAPLLESIRMEKKL